MTATKRVKHFDLITKSMNKAAKMCRDKEPAYDWAARHNSAMMRPNEIEAPIVDLIKAAASYADRHFDRYESKVGDDGVLGQEWEAIVKAIRALLNGETGRLDCGTLDGLLLDMMQLEGIDPDA